MRNVLCLMGVFCVMLWSMAVSAQAVEVDDVIIAAMIQRESSGDDYKIGDKKFKHHAYGCLQIRLLASIDVNRFLGTDYRPEDYLGHRELSIVAFKAYMDMYCTEKRLGRETTYEDMARIWNGGPYGCFENGAIDSEGNLPKREEKESEKEWKERIAGIALCQKNAKKNWLKVKEILEQQAKAKADAEAKAKADADSGK